MKPYVIEAHEILPEEPLTVDKYIGMASQTARVEWFVSCPMCGRKYYSLDDDYKAEVRDRVLDDGAIYRTGMGGCAGCNRTGRGAYILSTQFDTLVESLIHKQDLEGLEALGNSKVEGYWEITIHRAIRYIKKEQENC